MAVHGDGTRSIAESDIPGRFRPHDGGVSEHGPHQNHNQWPDIDVTLEGIIYL